MENPVTEKEEEQIIQEVLKEPLSKQVEIKKEQWNKPQGSKESH